MADEAAQKIALEEVTNAAFNGVLRALESRKMNINRFPGPIIVGLVAWPELRQGSIPMGDAQSET